MRWIPTLNVASSLGGPDGSCAHAWERHALLWRHFSDIGIQLQWHTIKPEPNGHKYQRIAKLNRDISAYTLKWTRMAQPFLVLGGDHSCAMGTWAGVLEGLSGMQRLGLIWLDAHLDAHTFLTTPSQNVHGMPVAALLGKGDPQLQYMYTGQAFLSAQQLLIVGARSYEAEEMALLQDAGVKVITQQHLQQVGLLHAIRLAILQLQNHCDVIGISLDLDVLDPSDAPGVETPVTDGISAMELLAALRMLNGRPGICGIEICEYSPQQDCFYKTSRLAGEIIAAFFADNKANRFLGSSSCGISGNSTPT